MNTRQIIPILQFVIFFTFSIPASAQEQDSIPPDPDSGYELLQADVHPVFPGNLNRWIASNLTIPYINLRNDTSVTVNVEFTVEKTGYVTNARVLNPSYRVLDKEIVAMISRMPRWKPGYLNRQPVDLKMVIPLKVDLGNSIRKPNNVPTPELSNIPRYKGGGQALAYFIRKNMQYPAEARKARMGGAITVEFLVMSNGSVGNPGTLGDVIGYGLEEEAIRIVEKMPRWIPASLDGKPVTAKHKVIIRFDPPAGGTAQKEKTD